MKARALAAVVFALAGCYKAERVEVGALHRAPFVVLRADSGFDLWQQTPNGALTRSACRSSHAQGKLRGVRGDTLLFESLRFSAVPSHFDTCRSLPSAEAVLATEPGLRIQVAEFSLGRTVVATGGIVAALYVFAFLMVITGPAY
jgi:hypothetical protein